MNTIMNIITADVSGIASDRVRVTISDSLGESKWCHLAPREAHDLAIEILGAAYAAQGLSDFRVLVGVAYES